MPVFEKCIEQAGTIGGEMSSGSSAFHPGRGGGRRIEMRGYSMRKNLGRCSP